LAAGRAEAALTARPPAISVQELFSSSIAEDDAFDDEDVDDLTPSAWSIILSQLEQCAAPAHAAAR
jgi:hypothetical protein